MYFDLNYNDECFTGLTICPNEKENPDLLYDYAQSLKIKNPACTFSEIAKAGKFNCMSDDDYRHALELVKTVSMFFNSKPEANVFHVLAEAISFILRQKRAKEESNIETGSDKENEEIKEDDFEWDIFDVEDDDDNP